MSAMIMTFSCVMMLINTAGNPAETFVDEQLIQYAHYRSDGTHFDSVIDVETVCFWSISRNNHRSFSLFVGKIVIQQQIDHV